MMFTGPTGALLSALAQLGLQDVSQPKALIHLAEQVGGSINQRELADALHISPATMAASLKSLERNGYITKQSDQRDGRCKLLHITQKGHRRGPALPGGLRHGGRTALRLASPARR